MSRWKEHVGVDWGQHPVDIEVRFLFVLGGGSPSVAFRRSDVKDGTVAETLQTQLGERVRIITKGKGPHGPEYLCTFIVKALNGMDFYETTYKTLLEWFRAHGIKLRNFSVEVEQWGAL